MKKRTTIFTALAMTTLLFAGCAASSTQVSRIDLEDAKEYDYDIDALTGMVIGSETPETSDVSSEELISEAEAKKIALAQVPEASESDIREFEVDYDDGRVEYEGSIYYGDMEYEFEIDGYSGAIRSWEVKSIYD